MVGKRNRIIEFTNFIKKQGIEININKNKARGNKGFFRSSSIGYRIDISKDLSEEEILGVMVHEFTHYIHFMYDKSLKTLDFIMNECDNIDIEEDLIKLTVESIPKDKITPIFEELDSVNEQIDNYYNYLKLDYPDIKKSKPYNKLEQRIKKSNLKYFLKYDKVKILEGILSYKTYSIDSIQKDFPDIDLDLKNYILLKSKLRMQKRLKNRITRLNKYYNAPTELLARSLEYYVTKPEIMIKITPELFNYYNKVIVSNKIPILSEAIKILNKI